MNDPSTPLPELSEEDALQVEVMRDAMLALADDKGAPGAGARLRASLESLATARQLDAAEATLLTVDLFAQGIQMAALPIHRLARVPPELRTPFLEGAAVHGQQPEMVPLQWAANILDIVRQLRLTRMGQSSMDLQAYDAMFRVVRPHRPRGSTVH